jgi:hypothetical protein
MIWVVHPGSGSCFFTHPGSRIRNTVIRNSMDRINLKKKYTVKTYLQHRNYLMPLAMVGQLFAREERVPAIRTEEGARPRVTILMVAQVALAHEPLVAAGMRAGVRQPDVDGALVVGQP